MGAARRGVLLRPQTGAAQPKLVAAPPAANVSLIDSPDPYIPRPESVYAPKVTINSTTLTMIPGIATILPASRGYS